MAVAALAVPPPAHAAPKKLEGTIALPGLPASSAYSAGSAEGEPVPTQQTCPGPGDFDGVTYKFFDLKGPVKGDFRLTGPKPAVQQTTPVLESNHNEYDIDIYGFDAKCVRVEGNAGSTGTSSGGSELFRPKKAIQFVVVSYYHGPYQNIPITVEIKETK